MAPPAEVEVSPSPKRLESAPREVLSLRYWSEYCRSAEEAKTGELVARSVTVKVKGEAV
jgi:hypothetical protein